MSCLRRCAPFLVLAVSLAGCASPDRKVLYSLGRQSVTVADFKALARGNEGSYIGTPDEAKNRLLDDMLRRSLLLHEADQRGMYSDTITTRFRRLAEERVLSQALMERIAPGAIGVSDAEVAQMLAWQDSSTHMQVIYTPKRDAAQAALAELRAGADFAATANRFNVAGFLPPGGDLGFLVPGQLVAPLDRYLRESPRGALVGPVQAPGEGWFVLQVIEREYRPIGDRALRGPTTMDMLRQRKQRLGQLRAFDELRREYRLELDPEGTRALFAHFNPNRSGMLEGLGETLPPATTGEARDQVLARWISPSGERSSYVLGNALDAIEDGSIDAPPTNMMPALEQWVEALCMRRLMVAEARRRLLHMEPDLQRQIDRGVDNFILDAIYRSDVMPLASTSDATVLAFYERIKPDYQQLRSVQVRSVLLPDSARAQALMLHSGHTPSMQAALAMAGESAEIKEESVIYPTDREPWQSLQAMFQILPVGDYGGPYPAAGGFLVFQVAGKDQVALEFDQLSQEQQRLIGERAVELGREQALQQVTDALRAKYNPVVNAEPLQRVRWPIDAAAPAAQR